MRKEGKTIPTMLLAGLIAGVLPARLAVTFGLGVANAAAGAAVSHLARRTVLAAMPLHGGA